MEFLSYLISGISLGSIYAIIALGYTMVYGIAKMLNFAHGDVIMVGAYVCFFAMGNFNLPPAVGVVLAGWMAGEETISVTGALALSIGIAAQNFPEGAIISIPLASEGMSRPRAFLYGALSGAAEPLAALLAMWAAGFFLPALPYLLGFAAGAMLYVVVEELIPEASAGEHSNTGTLFFSVGFTLMLALDAALK